MVHPCVICGLSSMHSPTLSINGIAKRDGACDVILFYASKPAAYQDFVFPEPRVCYYAFFFVIESGGLLCVGRGGVGICVFICFVCFITENRWS